MLHETKKIGSEFPIGVDLQQTHTHHDVLPPVPISIKLEGNDVKQQIMDLYPDLSRLVLAPLRMPWYT